MNEFRLSLDDVMDHRVSIGLDVYPPIGMKDERTRLNMFYEDVHERWADLYGTLTAGESEFRISKPFRKEPSVQSPRMPVDTFVLTQRGPVFVFPLRLPDPVGPTDLECNFRSVFTEVRNALWSRLPGHTILRVGLVRDVVFSTGQSNCTSRVTQRHDWLGAKLVGGHLMFQYRDQKCNIRLDFSPVKIGLTTQLPIGTKIEQSVGFGLKVRLDVNNAEPRPLQDADIEEVIDRALGFWPDELLEYVSGVGS